MPILSAHFPSLYSSVYRCAIYSASRSCVEPFTSAFNMTLPQLGRWQRSIDICCPRRSSAANQPHVAAAVDRRDRQTDRETDIGTIHSRSPLEAGGVDKRNVSCIVRSFRCCPPVCTDHRRKLLLGPGAQAPPTFMIMGLAYMTSPPLL